ncbi:MAG: BatA domain-containing protein [Planctomycetota bacterium]
MTILNPLILGFGLAAVAIPILIHLLMRRRRKPVQWAAMRFLLEAIRKRRRRLQLERWLLLATRCLALALLAFALGRPLLGAAGLLGGGPVTLYLLVDNSIAGDARDAAGTAALERHKAAALDLLRSLRSGRGDRVAIIPLAGPLGADATAAERGSGLPASADFGAVQSLVEAVPQTEAAADAEGALRLVAADIAREEAEGLPRGRRVVALLADAAAGVYDVSTATEPIDAGGIALLASWRPSADAAPGNTGIAAIEPIRPVVVVGEGDAVAQAAPVRVTVERSGDLVDLERTATVRVRFVDERGPAVWVDGAVRLRPGERRGAVVLDAPLSGRPRGLAYVEAILAERDALPADDRATTPVEVRRQLTVALIAPASVDDGGFDPSEPIDWLRVVLAPEATGEGDALADVAFRVIDPALIDAARLLRVDAAFVLRPSAVRPRGWRTLAEWAAAGGLVALFPDPDATAAAWQREAMRALGLPWSMGPDAAEHEAPRTLAVPATDDPAGLLRLVEGELPDLLRPVSVFRSMPLSAGGGDGGAMLVFEDGQPAALAGRPGASSTTTGAATGRAGRGVVVAFAVPLSADWTDLPARPVVVPLVQELVRAGVGVARGARVAVAGDRPAAPPAAALLRATRDDARPPQPDVAVQDGAGVRPIRRAGTWTALDASLRPLGLVSVTPDVAGANRDAVARAQVGGWLGDLAGGEPMWLGEDGGLDPADALAESEPRTPISFALLVAALALLAIETILARLFSHADALEQRPAAPGLGVAA